MHAVILAAGKGTRLLPITASIPKPLVEIRGRSLLSHVLDALPEKISHITIVIGYLGEKIREYQGNTYKNIPIRYVEQQIRNGTGGALALLQESIVAPTLVLNADDIYTKADLERLTMYPLAVLAISTDNDVANPFAVSKAGVLQGFLDKRQKKDDEPYWQNCGAYMIDPRYFLTPPVLIPVRDSEELSIPHTLVALAKREEVCVVRATRWIPVGTHEELAYVQKLGDSEEI